MFRVLNKPYPRSNEIREWLPIILISGLMVSIILFFVFSFRDDFEVSSLLVRNLLLFGLVTSACMSFTEIALPLLFKNFFTEEHWTVAKNILLWALTILLIAAGNMLMAYILYEDTISPKNFIIFIYYTLGIGFVINAVLTTINYRRLSVKFKTGAEVMTEGIRSQNDAVTEKDLLQNRTGENGSSKIVITSENEREKLEFSPEELLYIESADNYCKIFCLRQNRESNVIIRSSLKRIEEQVTHADFFRCHRAYIVNMRRINAVTGNSQGYRLKINGAEKEIPVSRNAGKELSEKLKSRS